MASSVAVKVDGAEKNEANFASENGPLDVVELVANSPNVQAADDIIHAFYPDYDVEKKFEFLKENFVFQIVGGSEGTSKAYKYYGLVIQSILSDVRDYGIASVRKKG
jgi:hypothetical protein